MRKQKTIRLGKKSPLVIERIGLINRVIGVYLNESFDSIIKTNYSIIEEGNINIYRFNTENGNSYDLEFIFTVLNPPKEKIDGGYLSDYLGNDMGLMADIAFVPSEINTDDRENHELYSRETNRSEAFELMGRISYLTKQFINNNPNINVYVIGKDVKETKLKIYLNLFKNIFSDDYMKLEGSDGGYNNGCFYFIKK